MKLPRFSMMTLLAVIIIVALDCTAFRAFGSRPEALTRPYFLIVPCTLPLVNILAVAVGILLRFRQRMNPFLLGFCVAGWLALIASALVFYAAITALDSWLSGTELESWLMASETREVIALFGAIPSLFLTPQLLVAFIGGWLTRLRLDWLKRWSNWENRTKTTPVRANLGVFSHRSRSGAVVEGWCRWKIDPQIQRLPAGSHAVVDVASQSPPKSSSVWQYDRLSVRIDRDAEFADTMELYVGPSPGGSIEKVRHLRNVQVTFLDGKRAGESTALPHCYLMPMR